MSTATMAKPNVQAAATPDFIQEIDRIFALQKEHRWNVAKTTADERIAKLKSIVAYVYDNREKLHRALYDDFQKPSVEADIGDVMPVLGEAKHAIKNLKKWMKPQRVRKTITMASTKAWIRYEPKGVALIIAPWNYPFNLTYGPLVSAIAAGNCAMIKPSELTPHTSTFIREMTAALFPEEEVAVFEGDKDVSAALLKKPFDHIFFTGSPQVGKIVMKAAAEHLSSVTLELGGKSPTIVDETADLEDAAQKIAWSKFANCGQTCIAPDYLMVHASKYDAFMDAFKMAVKSSYGENDETWKDSGDYPRIVNNSHFRRIKSIIDDTLEKGAQLELGGKAIPDDNYISPTLISKPAMDSEAMQQEIFGPVLPAMPYASLEKDVISVINEKEKPLALYIFSKSQENIEKVLSNTSAGGTCINDVMVNYSHLNMPFGGVNNSGIGKSHGWYGFLAFSNERGVLKHHKYSALKNLYPPYTGKVKKMVDFLVKYT